MQVRKFDYEKDINDAVVLFNRSFPERISREYLEWKHRDNPFGRSFGLVAIEDGKLVGLRMFMKWKFSDGKKTYNAIRPVDTCTDPEYRGKGIFRKLTLQGLEEIKGEYDFVFNTPNSYSIDGYLKMGWEKIEKPNLYSLGLINPFSEKPKFNVLGVNALVSENLPTCNNGFSTHLSPKYLRWRYKFSKYKIARFQDQTLVVFKLEKIKGMKVLVLLETCGSGRNITSHLNALALDQGALFVYYLKDQGSDIINFPISFKRRKQNVVVKDDEGINTTNLQFSAGDLEGII